MAHLQIKGLDEYAEKVKKTSKNADKIIKKAVYKGAEPVANAIKAGLKTIPIQEGNNGMPPYAADGEKLIGISRKQKGDLIDSMGLAPIQEFKHGYISTKVGWDGYGSVRTKQYPKGIPNQMLMRSVESGTSFRKKNPVVRKAVNKSKNTAVEKMAQAVDEELRKEFK